MTRKVVTALSVVLALAAVLAPTALAKGAERAYYLGYHEPTAAPQNGNVLMLHGGGWKGDLGAEADQVMSAYIADTRSWGYGTYNVGYRSGANSLRDVIDAARRVLKKNPGEPLCIVGGSAGAQLALIAAAKLRRAIDCVVDIGGPPDLTTPDTQPLSDLVVELATATFGALRLERLSPFNRAEDIRQPVLVVAPDCDQFTSLERQEVFAWALPKGELIRVVGVKRNVLSDLLDRIGLSFFDFGFGSQDPGVETGHCAVTRESFDAFRMAERAFLDRNM